MNDLIDKLVNFDTDYYLQMYPDLQTITKNMNDIEKKLFLLNHFVKHGYYEKRKYRLKSYAFQNEHMKKEKKQYMETVVISSDNNDGILDYSEKDYELSNKKSSRHRQKESHLDQEITVQRRLEEFRRKCKDEKGGHRDKKENFFHEIGN